jgi:hypothetical protein
MPKVPINRRNSKIDEFTGLKYESVESIGWRSRLFSKLRYYGSALAHFASKIFGSATSWSRPGTRLKKDYLDNHSITLLSNSRESPIGALGPNELALTAGRVSEFLNHGPTTERFGELPLDTKTGSEKHVVSLLIDRTTEQIYFIDGKGHRPQNLKLSGNAPDRYSVAVFIDEIAKGVIALQDYTVKYIDAAIQKPMDCALYVDAVVCQIVRSSTSSDNNNLPNILGDAAKHVYNNYKKVDALRAYYLARRTNEGSRSNKDKTTEPAPPAESLDEWELS